MITNSSITLNHTANSDFDFAPKTAATLAKQDFADSLKNWRIWFLLAYQDLKLRYRRSILGPFWITLSMAITVYSMGFLYAHLFKTNMQTYYPFLVAGMLGWSLISTIITEMSETFIASDGLIKQIKLPYSLYIHRAAARNLMIFFHNILVMLPIFVIFRDSIHLNLNTLLLIPSLAVIYINAITYGMILAIIGARYRDVAQIIKSLVQVVFFVTPVIWSPTVLPPAQQLLVNLNPFYAFIELIRAPLLGTTPTFWPLAMSALITLLGIFICSKLFTHYRTRIVYWL